MTADRRLAVFRADGGSSIGGGHIVRCTALARALRHAGWRCGLAMSAETLAYFGDFSAAFSETVVLSGDEPEAMAVRWPEGCELMVVNHYDRDKTFEVACKPWARRILVLDDLADRPHCCDMLLDGTPGRTIAAYRGRVPEDCQLLLGADYLPLRPDFAVRRRRLLPRAAPKAPRRLLLCLGAAPDEDAILGLIGALAESALSLSLDVAIGAVPKGSRLRSRLDAIGGGLHVATDEMAHLIETADIAVGAAGVGGWERCCLGLPSITLVLAENQQPNASALANSGAARVMPASSGPETVVEALTEIMNDPDLWQRMSTAASRMCDGLGLARIVERLEERCHANDGAPIHLRPAGPDDALTMLDWQGDPTTRRYARNPMPPAREEHMAWFAAKRADPRCVFNMITRGGNPAGVIRLDRMEYPDAYEVSVLVAPEHRRAGISRAALDLIRRLVPDADLWAYVKPENDASLALFRAASYTKTDRCDWYVHHAATDGNHGR